MAKAKTAKWRNRICGQGEEAPSKLLPNPRNWRLHPTAQRDAMKGVLGQVGWVQDVIVNRRTGHLVDGHLRVALALERGEAAVPVKYVELSRAEEALAELLVERHEDWPEEDLEPDQGDDPHNEVIVKPEAWERVKKEKERELAALVNDTTLQGRGKGKGLRIQVGSFYDRLGEPVPVQPEWAKEYDVVPDGEASIVAGRRYWRERARKAYRRGPTASVVHLPDLDMDFGEPTEIDKVVELHKKTLRDGIEEQWRSLGAVQQVISEVAAEFGGEDPALPEMRHVLDQCRVRLEDLHEETQRYTGPFELGEPNEEELAWVREIVERELG